MAEALQYELIGPRLERRVDGQLWAIKDGQARAVRVTRCFPWSAPGRLISLRDERRKRLRIHQRVGDRRPPDQAGHLRRHEQCEVLYRADARRF